MENILIHYGADKYDKSLVKPIINRNWNKPEGGLWTCPKNSTWGWKEWATNEGFTETTDENSFELLLKEGAKLFIIDSLQDLLNAPLFVFQVESFSQQYLDFELLATKYDAIWLTEKGQNETHHSYPTNLYGWDCETVLIMNPDCIEQK